MLMTILFENMKVFSHQCINAVTGLRDNSLAFLLKQGQVSPLLAEISIYKNSKHC